MVGLILCLFTACSSPSAQNRKVYDRYAELVAERNRTMNSTSPGAASAPVVKEVPSRLAPAPAPASPVATKPVPAPAPAAAKPEATVKPAPVLPPPVQVIVPKPVEKAPPPSLPPPVAPKPTPVVTPQAPAAPVAPAPVAAPATPSTSYVASPSSDGVAYMLKVGDVVQIYLRGIPTTDAIEDVIDEDGMISLPLINEIQAAGMTASELERSIRRALTLRRHA